VWGRSERKDCVDGSAEGDRRRESVRVGFWVVVEAVVETEEDGGMCGERALTRVSIVWRGSSGSQVSSH